MSNFQILLLDTKGVGLFKINQPLPVHDSISIKILGETKGKYSISKFPGFLYYFIDTSDLIKITDVGIVEDFFIGVDKDKIIKGITIYFEQSNALEIQKNISALLGSPDVISNSTISGIKFNNTFAWYKNNQTFNLICNASCVTLEIFNRNILPKGISPIVSKFCEA